MICLNYMLNLYILHYHHTHIQEICIYTNSFKHAFCFLFWNIPESIFHFWWRCMDFLTLWRAPPFLWILSNDGNGREQVPFVSKHCHYSRNRHWHLDLYPPALGTIPFGYWVSRVLGPSSKARDGVGLYT